MQSSKPLDGRIALVAGATRGAGRGIAVELGAAGATVYATGRTTRSQPSPMQRPETIEETAELVDAAGGTGIAVRVDHSRPDEVEALAARIRDEHGRLDILVNDVWGGDPLVQWGKRVWEHELEPGLALVDNGIQTHIITSHFAIPLLLESDRGLLVEVTDGDTDRYRGNLYYDLVKQSVIRLAVAQARELRDTAVTALALTPGFLRSEFMLEHFGVTEDSWRDAIEQDPFFAESETPRFIGRAVAALAADPGVAGKAGTVVATWDLAEEYGFDDIDGRRPHWMRFFREMVAKGHPDPLA